MSFFNGVGFEVISTRQHGDTPVNTGLYTVPYTGPYTGHLSLHEATTTLFLEESYPFPVFFTGGDVLFLLIGLVSFIFKFQRLGIPETIPGLGLGLGFQRFPDGFQGDSDQG